MKNLRRLFILLVLACTSLISLGTASAQNQTIDLPQIFTSQENGIFRYPAGWTLTEDTNFVSISDGKVTIEFYSQTLTDSTIRLNPENAPLGDSVRTFFSILGVDYQGATNIDFQGETVVGGFQVANGQAEYVFLGIGALMSPPGWIFIHIKGNAIDVLGGTETFAAIFDTFGTLQTVSSTDTSGGTANNSQGTSNVVIPEPTVPCLVRSVQANATSVRVGPGTNRSVIRFLEINRDFTVVGTADAADGSKWWRLDKNEAAPGQAANETWVADSQVVSSGGCDAVGTVAAPPIIRARPVVTVPDPEPRPEPVAGSTELFIDFFANPTTIPSGNCSDLAWDVRNAREVYYKGISVPANSRQTECPTFTTDYELRVVNNAGENVFRTVTVTVDNDFVLCGFDFIPFFETGFIPVGGEAYHYIFLDPCAFDRTIWIEMFANGNDGLDPYIDIFIDDVYYGSDDDGGGYPNAYIEVFVPAGSSLISITAKGYNLNTGGSYEILAEYLN